MKTSLTIHIDQALAHSAENYAKAQSQSLSWLIEELLYQAIHAQTEIPSTFSQRWRGKFQQIKDIKDEADLRFNYLKERYQL